MTSEVTISCPHCRRQYLIKVDPERLQRLKTRATCGRCGNAFDVAARVAAAAAGASHAATSSASGAGHATASASPPAHESPIARAAPPTSTATATPAEPSPPSQSDTPTPQLTARVPLRLERIKPPAPPPRERDDMAELAREFADAAARFTPVLPRKPPPDVAATIRTARVPPAPSATAPSLPASPSDTLPALTVASPASPSTISSPALPPLTPTSPALAPTSAEAAATQSLPRIAPAASLGEITLDDGGATDFDAAENTLERARKPEPRPRTWIEMADPGLAHLEAPASPTAALLETMLAPL